MKKIYLAALLILSGLALRATEVDYGMFAGVPDSIDRSIVGIRFGLPCSISRGFVEGAELSLCYSATRNVDGFKFALLGVNSGERLDGAALALVNFTDIELEGVQIGLCNSAGNAEDGIQIGLFNCSSDRAGLQIGLLNYNKNGWFPLLPLVNFANDLDD